MMLSKLKFVRLVNLFAVLSVLVGCGVAARGAGSSDLSYPASTPSVVDPAPGTGLTLTLPQGLKGFPQVHLEPPGPGIAPRISDSRAYVACYQQHGPCIEAGQNASADRLFALFTDDQQRDVGGSSRPKFLHRPVWMLTFHNVPSAPAGGGSLPYPVNLARAPKPVLLVDLTVMIDSVTGVYLTAYRNAGQA